jgi:hypothetical protein
MTFWLRRHVYVCFVQDSAIFLDVRRDKYLGLAGRQLQALARVVCGWRVAAELESPALTQGECERIGELFVREGLLTRNASEGKSAAPVSLDLGVLMSSIHHEFETRRKLHARDISCFLKSCAAARYAVKWRSLEWMVGTVASRKRPARFDPQTAAERVDVFRRLRCYFFTARGHCLFHSLALLNFLSRHGIYPDWVIGVRTAPWGAHSWVQQGSWVLDATPEEVRFYTPILVV